MVVRHRQKVMRALMMTMVMLMTIWAGTMHPAVLRDLVGSRRGRSRGVLGHPDGLQTMARKTASRLGGVVKELGQVVAVQWG